MYIVLWFSISISKEKHILQKKFQSIIFMNVFPRKWFYNNKKMYTKLFIKIMENCSLYYDFRSIFLKRNIFQKQISIKKFHENFSSKNLYDNFRGNDFARMKKFRPKLLIKIMDKCTFYYDFPSVFQKRNIFHKNIFRQKCLSKYFQG